MSVILYGAGVLIVEVSQNNLLWIPIYDCCEANYIITMSLFLFVTGNRRKEIKRKDEILQQDQTQGPSPDPALLPLNVCTVSLPVSHFL